MPLCPRCQYRNAPDVLQCSQCGLQLKAHGHPGIPLHQSRGGESLCLSCTYHADDTCTFPQRPEAQACTLYSAIATHETLPDRPQDPAVAMGRLLRRNGGWLLLIALILLSLLIAVL